MSQLPLRAFVVGSTGETGKALIKVLARSTDYSSVKLIQRRKVNVDYGADAVDVENRFTQHVVDFDHLSEYKDVFADTDVGFCALGTTAGKVGQEQMRIIDHDYVLRVAELCSAAGCKEFHLVSSKGANAKSRIFYLRLKGETENDLISQNLFSKQLIIYHPGTLLCSRTESRPFESVVRFLLRPVAAVAPTLLTTPVNVLAEAMARAPFCVSSVAQKLSISPGDQKVNNVYVVDIDTIFKLSKAEIVQK